MKGKAMTTKKTPTKTTTNEAADAKPVTVDSTVQKVITKTVAKKPTTAKPKAVTETQTVVETVTSEVKEPKKSKNGKHDAVIRDSFPFSEQDYFKLSELKKTCTTAGIKVKKGELLRAGLHLLEKLSLADLKKAIAQVEKVKSNRENSKD
jgi:hypothetical protein